MHIDEILRTPVGADLSRTPPIYRPFGGCEDDVRIKKLLCIIAPTADLSALDGCFDIPHNLLISIIAPTADLSAKWRARETRIIVLNRITWPRSMCSPSRVESRAHRLVHHLPRYC